MPLQKHMSVREAGAIARKLAEETGYEFVDAELVKEPAGRFLRFYVDKGEGITLDELEAYHRKIQPLVESVDYDYMEVSSPGADRPLKTERDFARAQGTAVEVKTYKNIDGQKRFLGDLIGLEDGCVIIDIGGENKSIPMSDVAIVKPYIDFEETDLE